MTRISRPDLSRWRAVILHRPHPSLDALTRQLDSLHIQVRSVWPGLEEADATADVLFFDADLGHDEQFPWPRGFAPMPIIALIGSEAPGRIEWALGQGANAHLQKPVGSGGAYGALLIAAHSFDKARTREEEIRRLEHRLRQRPTVIRAVLRLMRAGCPDETAAYGQLRTMAMDWGMTIEEASEAICRQDKRFRQRP